jgi:hypothetical protein
VGERPHPRLVREQRLRPRELADLRAGPLREDR